jgi:hypothetical protein
MKCLKNISPLVVVISAMVVVWYVRGRAQVLTPPPQELRYQTLLMEPIATETQQAVVAGTSVLLIKDRITGQCFLAVRIGDSAGLSPSPCTR